MISETAGSILLSHRWEIAGGFCILWCLILLAKAVLHPLHKVPGPLWARFSRLWYLRVVSRGNFERLNIDLHRRHGPIVRIAPGQYSLDDPEAVRIVYSHASKFTKERESTNFNHSQAPWYHASGNPDPESSDLFTDTDPRRHSANKRKVASLYSMSSLVQMEPCVVECTGVLVDRLTEFASSGKPFNLQHWMQYYAFDIIGLITVDKRFGFLDTGCDQNDFLASLHAYLIYAAHVGIYAELHPILSRVLALLPGPGIAHLASFTAQQVSETQKRLTESASASEKSNERTDSFLQKLLKMSIQDPEKITQADIFTTCITNIGAGSDTTSISLTALLYNLLKHPETYQKLRDEISRAKREGKLSFPVTFQESQRLPYLQACIKEALRIHPATGLPLVRVVPKGGITLCDKYIPEGEIVGVNSWVLHRNKSIFGDDADDYRPERWLEGSEKTSEMDRNFFAFGAGARTCIGKNISLMEIGKLIPELITRFDFELTEPQAELETQNVWFVKQHNVMCRVKLAQ